MSPRGRLLLGSAAVGGGLGYYVFGNQDRSRAVRKTEMWWSLSDGVAYCLRTFVDPERAHEIATMSMKMGLSPVFNDEYNRILSSECLGMKFKTPVGVAAGFDKQGEVYRALSELGYGFVEIGGVTPKPQVGNQRPRIFRLAQDRAIINRVGLPSDGAARVEERLKTERGSIPVGVNCAKNHDGNAVEDMASVVFTMPSADFYVLNASCPNVAGGVVADLKEVREAIRCAQRNNHTKKPILLKLSPDLSDADLSAVARLALKEKLDGLVLANTSKKRSPALLDPEKAQVGGISGKPLTANTRRIVSHVYKETRSKIPIIAVGGVFSAQDAFELILAGASLVQLYTGLIYNPPTTSRSLHNDLADLIHQNGFASLQDAIGASHRKPKSEVK